MAMKMRMKDILHRYQINGRTIIHKIFETNSRVHAE